MEQLLTANVATSMYWLGRYLERIEGTLYEINKAYDFIIDVDKQAGVELYKKFDIDLKYLTAMDFLDKSIRGDHAANLPEMMQNARENAIISRANIDEAAFGEIIELNELFQNIQKSPVHIDYNDIDKALSLINEIWGAHAKRGHRKCSDYFLRLGKLVEEVDFRFRFKRGPKMTAIIVAEIDAIFKILDPELDLSLGCAMDTQANMMNCIYQTIDKIIIND
ncbi:MAG: kinase [ANME-2 cluster archaeon]|nr:MAG: kinase [ANME-2 cluster archaeon]